MFSFGLKSEPYRMDVHSKLLLESLIVCHCLPRTFRIYYYEKKASKQT